MSWWIIFGIITTSIGLFAGFIAGHFHAVRAMFNLGLINKDVVRKLKETQYKDVAHKLKKEGPWS